MKLRKTEWLVKPCSYWCALDMVRQYHYAGTGSKHSVATHGLYRLRDNACYGITWWLPPPSKAAAAYVHDDWRNVLALSRMVIIPDAPKNAATFLLARSIKLLPERYHMLVTYADTWQGHTGTIYKAGNWQYDGMTQPKPVWIDKSGNLVSIRRGNRTMTKVELTNEGATLLGYFPKHRFTYKRFEPRQPVQLKLAM